MPRRIRKVRTRGTCDACTKYPRVLTEIESGQKLCRTCLRRLRTPKRPNPNAPASLDLLNEAYQLGITVPEQATHGDVTRRIRLARRKFPISDELMGMDLERLIQLQDDVVCYVADVWQQSTGSLAADSQIPYDEQLALAASLVVERRDTVLAIQRVQRQRARHRAGLEAEYALDHPDGGKLDWEQVKPLVAEDGMYQRLTQMLCSRWREYLPRRRGLLSRLFGEPRPTDEIKPGD